MRGTARVVGVGMVPFATPSRSQTHDVLARGAVTAALGNAGIDYGPIQQAYVGYVYDDSISGQFTLYGIGTTGIPVINVNNNCATGSSALWVARQAVESGSADCVLAVGFEQMQGDALAVQWADRPDPLTEFLSTATILQGDEPGVPLSISPSPTPGQERVVVTVVACGVCHTDLTYRAGGIHDEYPFLLGYEAAGTVETVVSGVISIRPGDFVILNWRAACGQCRACKRARPWYCFDALNAAQKMTLSDGTELTRAGHRRVRGQDTGA